MSATHPASSKYTRVAEKIRRDSMACPAIAWVARRNRSR